MAYNEATKQVILFGGTDGSEGWFGDTWAFDGSNWTQLRPENSPSPRSGMSMAYDPTTQTIVLFGGYNNGTALDDTWEWNGLNWVQKDVATPPSPRYGDMIAYNDSLGAVAMYGGQQSSDGLTLLSDTWKWDGRNWIRVTSSATPGRRSFAAVNEDEGVLFGDDGGPIQVNDCSSVTTWQLTAAGWNELTTTSPPPGRSDPVMAYDPASGTSVMFGGGSCNGGFLGDTWVFAGSKTNLRATSVAISASRNSVAVGKKVTLTAAVKPTPGGGTITFYVGQSAITICSDMALSLKGKARCHIRFSSPGSKLVTAGYSGDPSYQPSTSQPQGVRVFSRR